MEEGTIRNERFSGLDWALDEVTRIAYEDCTFHDLDWSEARLFAWLRRPCSLPRTGRR